MVAENEQDQESWYHALAEFINEGKKGFVDSEELEENYGTLTQGTVFKEVWQVNVKPKGLGQTKSLTGVYRLCLSSKMIHLVKLNSDVPCVHLQLMNIRRCGHSESFFFIEVGRSSSIGPGELWMQVDDSVVAQNMHETILETMKALKAFAEFRPRSKSQSSGTNPISFITTRRHLGNLPPSQTGLQRRARTESMTGTPPSAKSTSYRFRTSSEGEGTMTRPFRSATGSLIHLNTARLSLGRQEGSGRYARVLPGPSYHTRSASLPVSHFPSTTSPVSVSSSSGHGSASDTLTRPSSSSVCGSPTDGGFISSDEYGSSPGDLRYFRVRSNTPDSLGNTPPIREENCLSEYMSMNKHSNGINRHTPDEGLKDDYMEAEKCFRKRTHSLTKPAAVMVHQKTQTTPSLDESSVDANSLGGSNRGLSYSVSPKSSCNLYPENYSDITVESLSNQNQSKHRDDGYMPMMPGVAASLASNNDYMPMNLKSVSIPKQIVKSQSPSKVDARGYMMMFPSGSSSPPRSSFVSCNSTESNDKLTNGDYMDMSQGSSAIRKVSRECFYSHANSDVTKLNNTFFSLPQSFKAASRQNSENNEYVSMCSPGKLIYSGSEYNTRIANEGLANINSPSLGTQIGGTSFGKNGRATRPTRLSLGTKGCVSVSRMYDCAIPPEPSSPGEYINIEFGEKGSNTPYSLSAEGSPSSLGSSSDHRRSPLSDYMSVDLDIQSPKVAPEPPASLTGITILTGSSVSRSQPSDDYARVPLGSACISNAGTRCEDYTEMTFNVGLTPPRPVAAKSDFGVEVASPSSVVNRLCIIDRYPGTNGFSVPSPPSDPNMGPKVIRADPQGRRRHSSETFSSTTTVTPSSPFFTDSSKRHSSASFDSIWLQSDEGGDCQGGRMCRNTSAGFQNGLNYIALELRGNSRGCDPSDCLPVSYPLQNNTSNLEKGSYATLDFSKSDGLKLNFTSKD
nr:PREDICTED: insulin receptor substrate 4 [Latimeria chalumnae]|eukprot:XP_005998260.1 PREDICTED: insulin receptor substrate 4 [Latimeria chalumnae]